MTYTADQLAASGVRAVRFTDGREWVHPDHLGEVEAGIREGRRDDFVAALSKMNDDATRTFIAQAGQRGVRTPEFVAALREWVREQLINARYIPDCVHYGWKPL